MTEQERETHSPKQQTTNARNKTAPLATSAFTTEQSTVESPRARQGSSVKTHMSKGNHKTPVIIPAETTDYPLRIVNVVTGAHRGCFCNNPSIDSRIIYSTQSRYALEPFTLDPSSKIDLGGGGRK